MTDPAGPGDPGPDGAADRPSAPSTDLTEVVVESEILRRGHYLTFRIDTIERADGTRHRREIVGHPGAVAILAIDPAGQVLMVRQFRVPAGGVLLEVPAGTLDVDPQTGQVEDHAKAARRELEEETGYRAGTWKLLTSFWTAPGFATELMHLYLATDLVPADADRLGPDVDEVLELERIPLPDAVAMVERGEVKDAKSLVALLWADRHLSTVEPSGASEPVSEAEAVDAGTIVRLTYRLRMIEYLGAMSILARSSRTLQAFGLIVTASGLFALISGADPVTWLPPLVFGPLVLTGLFYLPFAWYALRKRRELVEQPSTVIMDSSGMTFDSSFGQSHLAWTVYDRIREIGGWFFFDTGAGVNHMMPMRVFSPTDLEQFRHILAEAGFGPDGRRTSSTS